MITQFQLISKLFAKIIQTTIHLFFIGDNANKKYFIFNVVSVF